MQKWQESFQDPNDPRLLESRRAEIIALHDKPTWFRTASPISVNWREERTSWTSEW
jgi:hypothetical protein